MDLEEHATKENEIISFEQMNNILFDFRAKEFKRARTSLLITEKKKSLSNELSLAIQDKQDLTILLQGPSGVDKTSTLLYIGNLSRKKGYVVFPLQAYDFVDQDAPLCLLVQDLLKTWIAAVGTDSVRSVMGEDFFATVQDNLSRNDIEAEKDIFKIFKKIVMKLRMCENKIVIFLVDQCNALHTKSQKITFDSNSSSTNVAPKENPVAAMFLDWNSFKARRGGIFYAFSSTFQLMPTARDGNSSLFSSIEPMNRDKFNLFVTFLENENVLAKNCNVNILYDLCGGIPREVRMFGSVTQRLPGDVGQKYQEWKNEYLISRICFYKSRIHRLLDKQKTENNDQEPPMDENYNENVMFAASLFVGKELTSAPEVWMASGLIVTKHGLFKLFCPAAEMAILSVFDDLKFTRQAIQIFGSDETISWRGLELAVTHLFRRARGNPIKLHYTDLCGANRNSMTITAGLIEYGGTRTPAATSIPRNTVYICARNTPVIDFFIHDAHGTQILLQVSESFYRDHNAKYDPEDSTIKAYAAAAQNPIPGAPLHYVYLTSDDQLMSKSKNKRSKHYDDSIMLIAKSDF